MVRDSGRVADSLSIRLTGPDLAGTLRGVVRQVMPQQPPVRFSSWNEHRYQEEPVDDSPGWFERMLGYDRQVTAVWSGEVFTSHAPGFYVDANLLREPDVGPTLDGLSQVPFTLASFASLHGSHGRWWYPYEPAGFGDLHYVHGWMCGFQGDGHRRLVSRRWLDFGPWRLLRAANDTTFVQFHDIAVDFETAVEQARAGHRLLYDESPISGFIGEKYVPRHEVTGVYDEETGTLRVPVHGREVSEGEMLDACAARLTSPLGPDRPIRQVAYVFTDPAAAEAHLHDLWLRELECWTVDMGDEIRLDDRYQPSPAVPAWVKDVEAREAGDNRRARDSSADR